MRNEFGDVSIKIPRDHNGEFESHIVKKYQKDLGTIEQLIIQKKLIDTPHNWMGIANKLLNLF